MSDQISESLSVEEIMERIRNRVRLRKQFEDGSPVPAQIASGSSQGPHPISLYDLTELRHNIAANNTLWNTVGTINPRPPGWHNSLIQLVKKVIARMLSWYTRPLHQFNSSVTRSLNETTRGIENLQTGLSALQNQLGGLEASQKTLFAAVGEQLNRLDEAQQAALAPLSERLGQLEQTTPAQLQALQNQLGGLETSQKTLFAAVGEQLNRLDEAQQAALAPLSERLGQLEQTTPAQLQALQDDLVQQFEALRQSQLSNTDKAHEQIGGILTQIEQLRGQAEAVANQVREIADTGIHERLRLNERNVRRLVHLLEEKGQPALFSPQPQLAPVSSSAEPIETELDYFWFEERFRGKEADIKERQRIYVDYFRGRQNVLDLGCGRGEFLELMRESGTSARGVEINTDMVLLCREKGLEVAQEDLFSYLESIPEESLDGMFCAQVIEHLTTAQQVRLISFARRKLAPGSPLVIETINPECLFVNPICA